MDRFIIHCDMNNYFASVEMLGNPSLEETPLVVCGDIALRHGIVLSKNNLAKSYGIVTGESVYDAKKKYKDVVCVIADYQKYLKYTKLSRAIYSRYSPLVYPYGLDEAWIDVTKSCHSLDDALKIARDIKKTIYNELKLKVSVGLSFNYIFAKLGSDKKDDDIYVIDKPHFVELTENLPAFDLLFVGSKTRTVLKRLGILTIGDLRKADPTFLKSFLGKKGVTLHHFAWGDDSEFNPVIENDEEIKSISNTITSPKDIKSDEEALAFIYILSQAIAKRLTKHNLSGKTVTLKIKLNDFTICNKQETLPNYTSMQLDIFNSASRILSSFDYELPIRSLSLRMSNLAVSNYIQLTLFQENDDEKTIKIYEKLKKKYGDIKMEQSSKSKDWD